MDQDRLVWFDRKGKRLAKVGELADYPFEQGDHTLEPGQEFRAGVLPRQENQRARLGLDQRARQIELQRHFMTRRKNFSRSITNCLSGQKTVLKRYVIAKALA